MEIEVGEYVRTNKGIIFIYDELFADDLQMQNMSFHNEGKIIKHSFNIIDLIEVGDYVNGFIIEKVSEPSFVNCYKRIIHGRECGYINEEIKTIVTKEQFELAGFEVKEEK